ncbi:hypothetical protein PIB30_083272 [Stylosanthes scabra]|uniref:Uncharacterized protein n=1 Tax=Stylosanthes scabra TaxID=79078 RepID=A0ABU6ST56_9FABA|nr:hypothetical protein [Stylosanthes scabra]
MRASRSHKRCVNRSSDVEVMATEMRRSNWLTARFHLEKSTESNNLSGNPKFQGHRVRLGLGPNRRSIVLSSIDYLEFRPPYLAFRPRNSTFVVTQFILSTLLALIPCDVALSNSSYRLLTVFLMFVLPCREELVIPSNLGARNSLVRYHDIGVFASLASTRIGNQQLLGVVPMRFGPSILSYVRWERIRVRRLSFQLISLLRIHSDSLESTLALLFYEKPIWSGRESTLCSENRF